MSQSWLEVTDPALSDWVRALRRAWMHEHPHANPEDFRTNSGSFHFRVRSDGTVEHYGSVGQTLSSATIKFVGVTPKS